MYLLDINPVAFSVANFEVKWYALAYILGILSSLLYYQKFIGLNKNIIDTILFYAPLCVVIGGRLGYVILYDLHYYLNNLLHIFSIWEGGMSFHGGFIGVVVAIYLCSKKHKISFWHLSDVTSCCAPVGIFLGRIANFINGELYGNVTDQPWGVIFKNVDLLPRHPSQLYEALGEGLGLFFITNYLLFFSKSLNKRGLITAVFVSGYAVIRIYLENFRVPDLHLGYLALGFTLGQWLSFVLLALGMGLFYYSLYYVPHSSMKLN